MSYKDYEGHMEDLIREKLEEIEKKEQVRVLHAVESGSRAWGFASPDSDYDVRFVYVRPGDYYLRLEEKQDFLNWELDETLDINGWDLSKALQHFHKSNATLYEWSSSPIVYRTTPEWAKIKAAAEHYFSPKACMYHYYGTANKNYNQYLREEMVNYKKYFYVLRPLLACKWIEERKCPPPVLFAELAGAVLEAELEPHVRRLLEAKTRMKESETGPRLDVLNGYIAGSLSDYKEKIARMPEDRNPDWAELDGLFRELIGL